jgi:DNA-binding CsgD family transcriptional regulator
MAHVVVLGLVLTLVAGVVSFAVLLRKIHATPSRLPQSIPTPLLLYNVWIAAWLVSQYLGFYLYPSIARPVAIQISAASMCATSLVSLAWLRSHLVLIDQFLESYASRIARRVVGWFVWAFAALLVAGWALWVVNPDLRLVGGIANRVTVTLIFPVALAASVLLALGARSEHDDRIRRALAVLAYLYVTLFSLLAALVLVPWRDFGADPAVLLSADLVLELAYNVLTVVWVARFADAFARQAPSEADVGQGFDELCESLSISKREREIIELICQGRTNREIADRLFISVGTVKDHNYTIFQKAGVRNRTELAQLFTRPAVRRDQARAAARQASGIRRVF